MHHCSACNHDFGHYRKPGQCPLCGHWEIIACVECGYRGAASFYLDNESKCPKCGKLTKLPGSLGSTTWIIVAAAVVALLVVGTITALALG